VREWAVLVLVLVWVQEWEWREWESLVIAV
jgi:hypothetical protein